MVTSFLSRFIRCGSNFMIVYYLSQFFSTTKIIWLKQKIFTMFLFPPLNICQINCNGKFFYLSFKILGFY